ncbi:MAG: hypothetical protein M3M95_01625 [Pseudomonadota bacterium]|nr:hypothetical protein [Pseudomonadota bacterium]
MLRLMFVRLLLVAAPFAVWFAYRWWARRAGRPLPATPYVWLFLAGIGLMTASLFATALLSPDTRDQIYVPAEVRPDGRITDGRYIDPQERP